MGRTRANSWRGGSKSGEFLRVFFYGIHLLTSSSSQVPEQFQTQYPTYANPPTLTVAVTAYIARLRKNGISLSNIDPATSAYTPVDINSAESLSNRHVNDALLAREYLTSIYRKLRSHYEWFRRTQRGEIKEWGRESTSRREGYRWRGRTVNHVLTSGLDDYPRAKVPHSGELHLDLLSWMAFFANTMSEIAEFLGEEDDLVEFQSEREAMIANIEGKIESSRRYVTVNLIFSSW
jgi:mannosyl-oligosaccharide glucosidase